MTTISFAELGLTETTLRTLNELGYEEPTAIQAQTIPLLIGGTDIIAQAQTGTGKTAAFALPILERLNATQSAPQALVLTPTRELAIQVAEAFHSYSKYHRINVLPVYGGQPIERQLRALERGVQVVVGTPGRLLDHIRRGTLPLGQIRFLILDEADEMLAMGFIEDIESILKETPSNRQTALFSATMPDAIVKLAQRYMNAPQRVTVRAEQLAVPQIRQIYYEVGKRDKFEMLARILDYERPTSAIIFCRTKRDVDMLGERLVARAYPAETIHGDLNQSQRDRVMGRFRGGQVELLIATDVAARGLDIDHVSHVFNYDIPLAAESYVHRIGRTGRAGRSGSAITLVTARERRLWYTIQRATNSPIQRMNLPTIADVVGRRRETFKEQLREAIGANDLDPYRIMAEELGEEFSPTDIAAAAFKLLLGAPPTLEKDPLAEPEVTETPSYGKPTSPSTNSRDKGKRPASREERATGSVQPGRGMTQIFLDVGREEGVRPGDIVGAIANEADIPGNMIGAIELFDHFSLVDVPSNSLARVLQALKRTTIRNRKINPTVATAATPPRTAKSTRPTTKPTRSSKPKR
jgi:ATP-dependent RNA helicase DeaD